jgi:transposase
VDTFDPIPRGIGQEESFMVMRVYSSEFKADAVALYLSDPSHTYTQIGNDLGITREALRNWVSAHHAPPAPPGRT